MPPLKNAAETIVPLRPSTTNLNAPSLPVTPTPSSGLRFGKQDALMLLVVVLWGSNFVAIKAAQDVFPPLMFAAGRFTMGAVVLAIVLRVAKIPLTLPRQECKTMAYLSFLGGGLYQPLWVTGLGLTTVANSALLIATAPVMLVMVNALRGKDRLGRGGVIGAFLALGGVALVILSRYWGNFSLGEHLLGDALTLAAATVWVWSVLASREPLQRIDTWAFSFWNLVGIAIYLWIFSIPDLLRINWATVAPVAFLGMLYTGTMASAFGSLIWNRGVKVLGPSRAVIYTNLQPIVAALTAAIFLHEPLTIWLVFGTVVVLCGVLLVKRG